MIGQLISNYGEIGFAGIIILLMVWLVKYLVKQSMEDKIYYRELITNDMKELHSDSLKNADLNNQTIVLQKDSIILQKDLAKDLREHNVHSKKAWNKTINSLGVIADRLNGGSNAGMAVKKELERYKQRGIVDRREVEKEVKVERRK